jgi:hypothetical protein
VTGSTQSTDFPRSTTPAAFDTTLGGSQDAFLTRLNPAGAAAADLIYSTYLGGDGSDSGNAIALDAGSISYLTGSTTSTNFPTSATPQALDTTLGGGVPGDVFITKLDTTVGGAGGLLYSTYLGGNGADTGNGIVVNASAHVIVTGRTFATDFPISATAFQTSIGAFEDAFVTKLDTAAGPPAALLYSSYLGANGTDTGNAIALDSNGHAIVVGDTGSTNFTTTMLSSTTTAAFQSSYGTGTSDAFIATVIDTASGSSGSTGEGSGTPGGKAGCFIATAAFGSPLAREVWTLREFRDRYLLASSGGRNFVALYYRLSPPVATLIQGDERLRGLVRAGLRPVVWVAGVAILYPWIVGTSVMMLLLLVPTVALILWRRASVRRGT